MNPPPEDARPTTSDPPPLTSIAEHVTWDLKDLLFCTVAVIGLFLLVLAAIIGPVVALTDNEKGTEALLAQAIGVTLWDAGMVALVIWFVRRRGGDWRNLGFRPSRVSIGGNRHLGSVLFVALMYGVSIATVAGYSVLVDLVGLDSLLPGQQIDDEAFDHTAVAVALGIAVVIAAPLAEEVFFRGFFFAGLRRRMPFVVAALISGFLFSLAHADPGLVIPFTLVGAILAFAYERSGSLYTNIGLHFVFNLLSYLALLFVPEARQ